MRKLLILLVIGGLFTSCEKDVSIQQANKNEAIYGVWQLDSTVNSAWTLNPRGKRGYHFIDDEFYKLGKPDSTSVTWFWYDKRSYTLNEPTGMYF